MANPVKPVEVKCRVTHFKELTSTVFQIDFVCEPRIPFQAGQFISIVIPGAGPSGKDLRRAYSIASGPENEGMQLCVKLVEGGPGTQYLYKLREGDAFRGFMPYGHFVFEPHDEWDAVFISTGTGLAPFRSMIFSKNFGDHRPPNTVCLFGVREVEEILYHEELSQVERLVWVPCVSRPEKTWNGFKGRVTDYLRGADSIRWTQTHFYLCGGGAMIDEVKAILNERGVQKSQIHQEIYYKTPKGDGVASEVTGT